MGPHLIHLVLMACGVAAAAGLLSLACARSPSHDLAPARRPFYRRP